MISFVFFLQMVNEFTLKLYNYNNCAEHINKYAPFHPKQPTPFIFMNSLNTENMEMSMQSHKCCNCALKLTVTVVKFTCMVNFIN